MTREATVSLQQIAESAAAVAEYTKGTGRDAFVANLAPGEFWTLDEPGENLVGFEDGFRRRRLNHVAMVERMIGLERRAGGSSDVEYLRGMPDVELFPEPWRLRRENPEPWP